MSGLTAAVLLCEAGVDVSVLEAGRRIGGRIHALRDSSDNYVLADLGPTWVWPKYQPVAARWLDTLGAETFPQFNDGDAVIVGYGPSPVRQPLPGQDGMSRLFGGPTALVEALSRRINPKAIRTSARVTGIADNGSAGVDLALSSGERISTQKVIVSMPLRVAAETLLMPWAPSPLVSAMAKTPTWMSTHAKAVAMYERPFWREAGLSGRIASRHGPLVEAHDHSGADGTPAAIFGFVGWPPEARRQDPASLRRAILDQLAACLGLAASKPLDLVVQDWADNPFIASARDLATPPEHPEIGPVVLRQAHLDGRLWFAVSEAASQSPGLIEGAFAAGEQAALAVLEGSA